MPLWTLLGLLQGKQTTPWPLAQGTDGQAGLLGMPRYLPELCRDDCRACADVCPTKAITMHTSVARAGGWTSITAVASSASFAPRPARPAPSQRRPTGRSACGRATTWSGNRLPPPRRTATKEARRAFRRSLHVRHVDAGSCNGCESELQALNNPFYNLHRLGIFFTASPRFADLLLVTGPVTQAMLGPLRATYDAMPEPRWVMAVGTCAVSGGIAEGGYACGHGLDGVLPVDVYLPGCPPNPAAIIQALLMFLERAPQRVKGGRLAE